MAIERELKLRLTAEEASHLLRAAGPARRSLPQVNHYLDTARGELRKRHFGLRLREENGAFYLTLKGPSRAAGDIHQRLEIEAALPAPDGRRILAEGACLEQLPIRLPNALADLRARTVAALGAARNTRRILRVTPPLMREAAPTGSGRGEPFLILELDETCFPDGSIDHELELELPEQAPTSAGQAVPALRAFLTELGIPWRPRRQGKYGRFLERSGLMGSPRHHRPRLPLRPPRRRHRFLWRR